MELERSGYVTSRSTIFKIRRDVYVEGRSIEGSGDEHEYIGIKMGGFKEDGEIGVDGVNCNMSMNLRSLGRTNLVYAGVRLK